jgi:hypothetical protein
MRELLRQYTFIAEGAAPGALPQKPPLLYLRHATFCEANQLVVTEGMFG